MPFFHYQSGLLFLPVSSRWVSLTGLLRTVSYNPLYYDSKRLLIYSCCIQRKKEKKKKTCIWRSVMIWITLQRSPEIERSFEMVLGHVELALQSTTNNQSDLEQAIMAFGLVFSYIWSQTNCMPKSLLILIWCSL